MDYEYRVCLYTSNQFAGGEEPTFSKSIEITIDQESSVTDHFSPIHGHYTKEEPMDVAYVVDGDPLIDELLREIRKSLDWVEDTVYICFERKEDGKWAEYVSEEYSTPESALNILYKFQDYITEDL